MCRATPFQIKKINNKLGIIEDGREVKLILVPGAKVGDYVLVQADMALQILDKEEAESLKSMREEIATR